MRVSKAFFNIVALALELKQVRCLNQSRKTSSFFQMSHIDHCPAPTTYGVVLFPGFAVLDVFGPIEALNGLSMSTFMNLSIIADTLSPVSSNSNPGPSGSANSTFSESVAPTHTFQTAPPLDVLIIPGGFGTRGNVNSTVAFVKERYSSLKYLLTVCTGSGIAARAGVLDGKHATTNKRAWAATTALGPNVNWVAGKMGDGRKYLDVVGSLSGY